jgi:hypothetical protein
MKITPERQVYGEEKSAVDCSSRVDAAQGNYAFSQKRIVALK